MPTSFIQHLLPGTTSDVAGGPTLPVALIGAAAGLLLWLAGARLSRGVFTLLGVAAGGVLGMNLPHWQGWAVNPMGTVIVCAIALGFAGYLLHLTCTGVVLALLLAGLGTAAVWAVMGQGAAWQWPDAVPWAGSPDVTLDVFWRSLPEHLNRAVPAAVAGGFAVGVLLTVFRPKFAAAFTYSLLGTPLLVGFGLPLLQRFRPQWIEAMPPSAIGQWAVAAGLVVLGTMLQWFTRPRDRKAKSVDPSKVDQTVPASAAKRAAPPRRGPVLPQQPTARMREVPA